MGRNIDLIDRDFGRLLVVAKSPSKGKNSCWICRCECGNTKIIRADLLLKGVTTSCGCRAREVASALMRRHGMSKTPEYIAYQSMKSRCDDPNNVAYPSHGGRGISVCEMWQNSFENFYADMGPRPSKKHSLDRKNNDGNYEPDNCRWATASMQARNMSRNRMVTIDDVSFCVADWCDLMGIDRHKPYNMLYWNKRSGIASIDEAVEVLYREWQP